MNKDYDVVIEIKRNGHVVAYTGTLLEMQTQVLPQYHGYDMMDRFEKQPIQAVLSVANWVRAYSYEDPETEV